MRLYDDSGRKEELPEKPEDNRPGQPYDIIFNTNPDDRKEQPR
jgi:hypothetical protein